MANRPRRRKRKTTSRPNTFIESQPPDLDDEQVEPADNEDKTYRNQPKKRKPFVTYISMKRYKPKNLDRYFK